MIFPDDIKGIKMQLERYVNNPLALPLYSSDGCVHPDVLYFPHGEQGYKYWLFYTPYPPQNKELPVLVRSNDGINFSDKGVDNPLLKTGRWGWDREYFADQDVIRVGADQWFMYYAGNHKIQQIGVALSRNGLSWSKFKKNPIISKKAWEKATKLKLEKNIKCPAAIWSKEDKKVYLYFSARHSGIEEVFMATSSDGLNFWIFPNPVLNVGKPGDFDAGALHHIDVTGFRDFFILTYVGSRERDSNSASYALGMAVSLDKIFWHKIVQNPFLSPAERYEGNRLYRSSLCDCQGEARLYYSVNDANAKLRNISLATIRFSN